MVDFTTTLNLNPDLLELLLSYTHQIDGVLNGTLTFSINCMNPGQIAWGCNSTAAVFEHVALEALDPELLDTVIYKLENYPLNSNFITGIQSQNPERLKIKGVNMNVVKYAHLNSSIVEYYNNLYNILKIQTNNFDSVKLGERIVFVPGTLPENFEGIRQTFEPLTEEFKLFSKYVKSEYCLEESFKDMASLKDFLEIHGTYYPDMETYQKNVCEFMANSRDVNGLSLEKLNSYQEKYDACILVTPENCRIYTRGRYILNMFVELNQHVIKHVASNLGYSDSLEYIYSFIGTSAYNILKHQHNLYLDHDNYPVVPEMYCTGIIEKRLFPEAINYTNLQRLCFCNECKPFPYTATLYSGNDGKVYIIVSLREQSSSTFIEFLEGKSCKCMFNLFLFDIEYYKLRLEYLDTLRIKIEEALAKIPRTVDEVIALVRNLHNTWFSPFRQSFVSMQVLDHLRFPKKENVVFF